MPRKGQVGASIMAKGAIALHLTIVSGQTCTAKRTTVSDHTCARAACVCVVVVGGGGGCGGRTTPVACYDMIANDRGTRGRGNLFDRDVRGSVPPVHLPSWAKSPAQGWLPQNVMLMHFLPPLVASMCNLESYFHVGASSQAAVTSPTPQ